MYYHSIEGYWCISCASCLWHFLDISTYIFVLFFFQFILLFALIDYSPVKYGDYDYPKWADALGWLLAIASVICIPIVMIRKLYKEDDSSSLLGVNTIYISLPLV